MAASAGHPGARQNHRPVKRSRLRSKSVSVKQPRSKSIGFFRGPGGRRRRDAGQRPRHATPRLGQLRNARSIIGCRPADRQPKPPALHPPHPPLRLQTAQIPPLNETGEATPVPLRYAAPASDADATVSASRSKDPVPVSDKRDVSSASASTLPCPCRDVRPQRQATHIRSCPTNGGTPAEVSAVPTGF